MEVVIASGDATGQRREITDWVKSTTIGTVLTAFTHAIADGVSIEIGSKGFWSDREILDWANDGANDMINRLADEVLADTHNKVSGTNGVAGTNFADAPFPSDYVRTIVKHVLVDDVQAPFIPPNEIRRFLNDPFTPGSAAKPTAALRNSKVVYKPNTSATITWNYLRTPAVISGSTDPDFSEELAQILVDYVIHRGLRKNSKRAEEATLYWREYTNKIQNQNAQYAQRNKAQG
jgi:hypothetical protein